MLLASEDTVTPELVALIVIGCVCVVPTATSPKLTRDGVIVNCPEVVCVPVPLKGTFRVAPDTRTLPLLVIADCGVKVRLNVTLCPPFKLRGKVGPLTEKPLPVVVSAESVTCPERVFVSTTGTVELFPTDT